MSDAVEPLDLGAIRERVEKATRGPWTHEPYAGQNQNGDYAGGHIYDADGEYVVTEVRDNDGAFMAHAREDVPALLAEVERLRAALTTARRGALTEAADEITEHQAVAGMFDERKAAGLGRAAVLVRARAAQEEGR